MAAPTLLVEIYSPLSTSWVDVTSSVHADSDLRVRWGRTSQFESHSPRTASFTLDNNDGTFTPGVLSAVVPIAHQPVRITVDSVLVFTGRILSWVARREPDGQFYTDVSAVDESYLLAGRKLGPYGVERAIQIVSTGTTWPLMDFTERTTRSVWGRLITVFPATQPWRSTTSSMTLVEGSSVVGVGTTEPSNEAPPFLGGSARFAPAENTVAPVLELPSAQTFSPGSGGFVSLWFRAEADYNDTQYLAYMWRTSGGTGAFRLYLNSSNALVANCVADGGSSATVTTTSKVYADGAWHHAAVTFTNSGKTVNLYIDGSLYGSATAAAALTIGSSNRRMIFGGASFDAAFTAPVGAIRGNISTITVDSTTPASTAPQELYYAGALGTDTTSDTVADRCDRILSFFGGSLAASSDMTASMPIGGQNLNGQDALSGCVEAADTERGVFYLDASGATTLRGQTARSSATVALTLDAVEDLTGDSFSLVRDTEIFANRIEVSWPGGTLVEEDAASVAEIGPIVDSWSCLCSDQADVESQATARLNYRTSVDPRLPSVTIDLLTAQNSIASTALGLAPLDRVSVEALPSTLGSTTRDGITEGWELTASASTYTVRLDLGQLG